MNKLLKELRNQSKEDLEYSLLDVSKEIFHLRNKLSFDKKLDKPHLLKAMRKKKARILTILTEKGR